MQSIDEDSMQTEEVHPPPRPTLKRQAPDPDWNAFKYRFPLTTEEVDYLEEELPVNDDFQNQFVS